MPTWYGTKPTGSDQIRNLVITMPANWTYLSWALSAEHNFPGTVNTNAGKHKRLKVRSTARCSMASVASLPYPAEGALAYVLDHKRLLRYNGTAWVAFTQLVHRKNGFMTGNLVVRGTDWDGRSLSADGAKLDTLTASSVAAAGSSYWFRINGETILPPVGPAGVTISASDCLMIAAQAKVLSGASTHINYDTGKLTTPGAAYVARVTMLGVK